MSQRGLPLGAGFPGVGRFGPGLGAGTGVSARPAHRYSARAEVPARLPRALPAGCGFTWGGRAPWKGRGADGRGQGSAEHLPGAGWRRGFRERGRGFGPALPPTPAPRPPSPLQLAAGGTSLCSYLVLWGARLEGSAGGQKAAPQSRSRE